MQIKQNRFTFPKKEKLTSKKIINDIYLKGLPIKSFPLIAKYLIVETNDVLCKILITVSKKKFKRSVDRNRIKRLIRESYRLNKSLLFTFLGKNNLSVVVSFAYVDSTIQDFQSIQNEMVKILHKIIQNLSSDNE